MQQIVTITKQGQITIPSRFRRHLALDKFNKAFVRVDRNKIILEPIVDFLSLGGVLKNKAIRNKKIEEIINLEEKAIEKIHK